MSACVCPEHLQPCPHCSQGGATIYHVGMPCPRVKAIEYWPDGSIKRVELNPAPVIPAPWNPMDPPRDVPSYYTYSTGDSPVS